ncbi:MAG: DUF61 family protein [Thermoprotei archaeon]
MYADHFYEELLSRVLREELIIVNKHLPYKRVSLCKLLEMPIPYYTTRDGSISIVDRRELEYLRQVAGDKACELYIPIVIEYSPSMGESTYIIRDRVASEVIAKILGIKYSGEALVIYRPHLIEIRSRLRTTSTIVFTP